MQTITKNMNTLIPNDIVWYMEKKLPQNLSNKSQIKTGEENTSVHLKRNKILENRSLLFPTQINKLIGIIIISKNTKNQINLLTQKQKIILGKRIFENILILKKNMSINTKTDIKIRLADSSSKNLQPINVIKIKVVTPK